MKNILLSTAVVSLLAACGGSGASDTITPDDAHIDLSKEKKGSVVINTPNGRLHGYNQYASFYGVWVDDNKAKRELRYRGDKTVNVPQSGKAVYHGNAVRWDSVKDQVLNNGESTLNVDFGERTVDGKIIFKGFRRDITLEEGALRGAEYKGTASVVGDSKGRYEGKNRMPEASGFFMPAWLPHPVGKTDAEGQKPHDALSLKQTERQTHCVSHRMRERRKRDAVYHQPDI